MEEKARQRFMLKLYNQGFLIEDRMDVLILRPRGYAAPAELTIREALTGEWEVTAASGAYASYVRGFHRRWFEGLINSLAFQATQEPL